MYTLTENKFTGTYKHGVTPELPFIYREPPKGIRYAADYYDSFINRSLVDKRHMDDLVVASGMAMIASVDEAASIQRMWYKATSFTHP